MAKQIMTLEERKELIASLMGKGVDELKELSYLNYKRSCELEEICKGFPSKSKEHKSYYTLYKFYLEKQDILERQLESAYFVAHAN